jgi:hypothetical protein
MINSLNLEHDGRESSEAKVVKATEAWETAKAVRATTLLDAKKARHYEYDYNTEMERLLTKHAEAEARGEVCRGCALRLQTEAEAKKKAEAEAKKYMEGVEHLEHLDDYGYAFDAEIEALLTKHVPGFGRKHGAGSNSGTDNSSGKGRTHEDEGSSASSSMERLLTKHAEAEAEAEAKKKAEAEAKKAQ